MVQKTKTKKGGKKLNMQVTKRRNELPWLYFAGFLLGFQMALVIYVFSNFLQERSGFDNVGIFYIIGYIASFYVLLNLHQLVKKYGKTQILLVFLAVKIIALFGIGFFFQSWIALIFGVWSLMSGALMWVCLDLMVENFSKDKTTGRTRGINLTAMNAGILVAPFLATWIVENLSYRYVFFVAGNLTVIVFVIIFIFFRNVNHNLKRSLNFFGVFKKIISNKDISRIYYISLLLEIFYAIAVVYTPLYLLEIGLSFVEIGKIFTVMLIPFVVIQYPLGVLADKKTGEKEWLMVGLLIGAIFTASISFTRTNELAVWMFILFMTRIGAAIIEIMRDSYFYKKVKSSDVDIIDYFRTTRSIAYVIGMSFVAIFLFFFEIRFVFIPLSIMLFSGIFPLWKLNDSR